jgi:isopentenyldiphosphate isomerase
MTVSSGAGRATDPYTNPDELFDVLDAEGRPTGRVKRRADVHRDGDWHRAFHCWVLDESERDRPHLLFQRRGAHKDTWPSRLDVTVGGHYGHGETLRDVVREVEEEIGRSVSLDALVPLGVRQVVGEREAGIRDREIQDLFLWRSDAPLAAYRPQPVEVTSLERVAVADVLALLTGSAERIAARVLTPDGAQCDGWVTEDDLIPTLDRYYYRVAVAVDLAARGYAHLVV